MKRLKVSYSFILFPYIKAAHRHIFSKKGDMKLDTEA